jgi:L-Lysine epsilon oxidase N-terminal/L-lysine epsilon oxidase C-terminal domain
MQPIYKIHPGIGVARLGNSPTGFYLGPQTPGGLPIACDPIGNPLLTPDGTSEVTVDKFKDAEGRVKRQAARFEVYVYDDQSPEGRPLKLGDRVEGGGNAGTLIDIQWRVYLANKKSAWYEFQQLDGEHGYAADHPLRNKDVTDSSARQCLIIDPGPRIVDRSSRREASFGRDGGDIYAATFPPPLSPDPIDSLGDLKTDDEGRLLVLGGFGHSGTYKASDFGQPRIESYANTEGWFDDTSDGPVAARLVMYSEEVTANRFVDVESAAWIIVGYPRYAPQILDMVTLDDVLADLSIREFADRLDIYGVVGTFDDPEPVDPLDSSALEVWKDQRLGWNPDYRPWFYRDIWPILDRPDQFSYVSNILGQSNFPHNQSTRGEFDKAKLSIPPMIDHEALERCEQKCLEGHEAGELVFDRIIPTLLEAANALGLELGIPAPGPSGEVSPAPASDLATNRQSAPGSAGPAPAGMAPSRLGTQLFSEFKAGLKRAIAGSDPGGPIPATSPADQPDPRTMDSAPPASAAATSKSTDELEKSVKGLISSLEEKARGLWPTPPKDGAGLLDGNSHAEVIEKRLVRPLREALARALSDHRSGKLLADCKKECLKRCTRDPYQSMREYLVSMLRRPGEENQFSLRGKPTDRTFGLPLMPLLCGDNPLSNSVTSKFLRLTDYQLYLLGQWAKGLFVNEVTEGWIPAPPSGVSEGWDGRTGRGLDRTVLSNMLGGAFCPGGEVSWIIRNPSIYSQAYRIKADPSTSTFQQTAAQANALKGGVPELDYVSYQADSLSLSNDFDRGLQPGDLTKSLAVPWQADFNECTTQSINITYDSWAKFDPSSEKDRSLKDEERVWVTMWWPAHRPLQVFESIGPEGQPPNYVMVDWSSGIPQSDAGDLKMVTAWPRLGFVVLNPDPTERAPTVLPPNPKFISTERSEVPKP